MRLDAPPARLTYRDRWLLEALAKMRFLTTRQIATLFFGRSRSAANKRLRRLVDAQHIAVWMRNLSEDNVYSITRKGARLRCHEMDHVDPFHVPRGLDPNLDHLLAINTVRIALAVNLEPAGGHLDWWQSDWELRIPRRSRLVPDAFFAVTWDGDASATYALELDHHTKAPRRFLKKIVGYGSHRFPCGQRPMVLVVGHDPRWLERYRTGVAHLRLAVPIWFAALSAVAENPLGAIWRAPQHDDPSSLRTLRTLPYGRERLPSKTDDLAATSA